jgi:LmbE family N-acetylglucosaminyl deacetylase
VNSLKPIFDNVLVLSPHTDDGELATGGTVARLIENGCHVHFVAFSAWTQVLKDECAASLRTLGVEDYSILDFPRRHFPEKRQDILQYLYDLNQEKKFDLVLTPSTSDLHQDHQTVTNEALRAFKQSSIFGYELPWNHIEFRENGFVSLERRHIDQKLKALWCYETQHGRPYFDKEYLIGLTRSRGLHVGIKYAEAYEVIKVILGNP